MDSFENFFSENTISVLISLISLILVVIFQYTIPLVRNNELMKHKLLNVYVPLCKAVNLQKAEFLAKYNEIRDVQFAYIPPKLNELITSYSKSEVDSRDDKYLKKEINDFIRKQYGICQNNLQFDQTYIGFILIIRHVLKFFATLFIVWASFMTLITFAENEDIMVYGSEIIKYSLIISSFFAIVLFIALTLKESKARK